MALTYSLLKKEENGVDYVVHRDGEPTGLVMRAGDRWAGARADFSGEEFRVLDAWGPWRRTRKEATADLLAGITFLHYEAAGA